MSGYLIDTNIVSELRRPNRNPPVVNWFSSVSVEAIFISVLTLGELRRGIEQLRLKDSTAAATLDRWLTTLRTNFRDRVLSVDDTVAEQWGRLSIRQPLPSIDGLLAATALVHNLIMVTRNTTDFERSGVACLNPFEYSA